MFGFQKMKPVIALYLTIETQSWPTLLSDAPNILFIQPSKAVRSEK